MAEILIGTSGYDYPEWKGSFYPDECRHKDFLSFYAGQFNALELNNTFYNMPTSERLLSFYERSGGRVKFSIKANRLLTHERSKMWKEDGLHFREAVEALKKKDCLAAVLFQFPESFYYIDENRLYLADLTSFFADFPVVVEFRHRQWLKDSVFEGLYKRNVGLVFCDMPQLKNLPDGFGNATPFIGDKAYIRLHGRNSTSWYANGKNTSPGDNGSARYCYDYEDSELELFVPVIKKALDEGRSVQVYFNNHPKAYGPKNAKRLDIILEERGVTKKQKK